MGPKFISSARPVPKWFTSVKDGFRGGMRMAELNGR